MLYGLGKKRVATGCRFGRGRNISKNREKEGIRFPGTSWRTDENTVEQERRRPVGRGEKSKTLWLHCTRKIYPDRGKGGTGVRSIRPTGRQKKKIKGIMAVGLVVSR